MAADCLSRLPPELLEMVVGYLDDTASISRLCRSNRHLSQAFGGYLYRYDARLASWDRCKALRAAVMKPALKTDTRVSIARKSLKAGADTNLSQRLFHLFPPSWLPNPTWAGCYDRGSIFISAVARGRLPLLQVLVDCKVDINICTERYRLDPITIALLMSQTNVFLFLLHQPTLDFRLGNVLNMALPVAHRAFAKTLVPYVNPNADYGPWNLLLWIAFLRHDSAMVASLLSCEKVYVYARRKLGLEYSGYSETTERASTVFAYTCRYGTLDMVKLLHDHSGVDVDLCNEHDNPKYPPARAAMDSDDARIVDFRIESSKCKTARDYVFRAACAEGKIELADKVLSLAGEHDKKHAKSWIGMAELYSLTELARYIRRKWYDVQNLFVGNGHED